MPDLIRVACVQLTTRADKAANLEKTERLVAKAAAGGADVVLLPEKWNAIGGVDTLHAAAETIEDGESVAAMRGWASGHGITLVGGSITERREGREKLSNTSLVFDPDGELVATYRQSHLFDGDGGGHSYRESDAREPGEGPPQPPVAREPPGGGVPLAHPGLAWLEGSEEGRAWLARLPDLVHQCTKRWALEPEEPFKYALTGLAIPAGEVVLKIQFPDR